MALVGDIKSFKLNSLLQLITMEGKSGALRIDDGERQAKCYFQAGRLYHCSIAKLTGSAAFFELLIWEEGEFMFDERGRIDLRTIYEPIDSLLIQGSRLLEEWKVIKSQGFFEDEVFEAQDNIQEASSDFTMKPDDWKTLRLVDGKLNARQIAEKSGLGYLSTYRILFALKSAGIITSLKYKLIDLTLIPQPHRGQSLFVPKNRITSPKVGVETAMQDLVYQQIDGHNTLERITARLHLDQKRISIVITQLYRQGLISLVDAKGNNIPLEKASIGDSK
ncbi:MAG: DUF4388 domain-containing protein [Caldisericia bacterium]|nr:DUF4388 domain-containing protein [Caldisericia bacterium]